MSNFASLREKHQSFSYRGFSAQKNGESLLLLFDYLLAPDIPFQARLEIMDFPWEKYYIKVDGNSSNQLELPSELEALFFQLGLAEIPSYWKAACPPEILLDSVMAQNFAAKEIVFWQELLRKGLGEFFFQNQIDFRKKDFLKISVVKDGKKVQITDREIQEALQEEKKIIKKFQAKSPQEYLKNIKGRPLVPLGGGKDSAVVLALLEDAQIDYDILLLAPHSPAANIIAKKFQKEGRCQKILRVKRTIDPQLIKLNQAGYLNGHSPFSAYLAFLSVTIASIFGNQEVILGNEASADEENHLFHGEKINHQYSKSTEFEAQFQEYSRSVLFSKKNTGKGSGENNPVAYFSLLRQLSELAIAGILCQFAQNDQRFSFVLEKFRSCNLGQQKGIWCHHCPKCAFVFLLFSAFLDPNYLSQKIFQENLFEKEDLEKTFEELLGLSGKKPFECVGTFAESRQALLLSFEQYQQAGLAVPKMLLRLKKALLEQERATLSVSKAKDTKHFPKPKLSTQIADQQEKLKKVWENKKILIFGLGKEGLSNYQFLRKLFPQKTLFLADQKSFEKLAEEEATWQSIRKTDSKLEWQLGENALKRIKEMDLLLKTPGIPASLKELQEFSNRGGKISSNTELFFQIVGRERIIGITGTKGKSSTSSLSFQLLDDAGVAVVFVGNIGSAALDVVDKLTNDTWVIYELSAHQLAELQESPHIAIIQEVFSEHLDYYQNFEKYFQAKTAISRFQSKEDICIFNPELATAKKIAGLSPGIKFQHRLLPDDLKTAVLFLQEKAGKEWIFARNFSNLEKIDSDNTEAIIEVAAVPLLGRHNLYNIMPAILLAQLFNIPPQSIRESLKSFQSLPHRLEFVEKIQGVAYYNDSIATNPPAVIKALQAFPEGKVILLAGGYDRLQDFQELGKVILTRKVKKLLLFPPTGKKLLEAIKKIAQQTDKKVPDSIELDNMPEAVKEASQAAKSGDIVLLSPAAPSFGVFKDYRDRGQQFRQAVRELTEMR